MPIQHRYSAKHITHGLEAASTGWLYPLDPIPKHHNFLQVLSSFELNILYYSI